MREGEREEGGIVVMKRERERERERERDRERETEREDKRDWERLDKGGER